jgi:hypothetical protein
LQYSTFYAAFEEQTSASAQQNPPPIGKILSNRLSNVSEYDKILSERNHLRQVRTVHEKGDFLMIRKVVVAEAHR